MASVLAWPDGRVSIVGACQQPRAPRDARRLAPTRAARDIGLGDRRWAEASPTRSGPEGSSRNEFAPGRLPVSTADPPARKSCMADNDFTLDAAPVSPAWPSARRAATRRPPTCSARAAGARPPRAPPTPSSRASTGRRRFDDLIGQEAMVRTLKNAFATGRIAHAFMLTGVRGVGKTTTARLLARALNYESETAIRSPGSPSWRARAALPRHPRGPAHGRAGARRRQQHQGRGDARTDGGRALRAGRGPLQGLHHRRSAHALDGGVQRPAEDPRGAAAARQVHLRHHRDPQGAGDHPLALPALRPAPRRAGGDSRQSRRSPRRRARRSRPRRWR